MVVNKIDTQVSYLRKHTPGLADLQQLLGSH